MTKTDLKELKKEFDEIFNWESVFCSDNFEDQKYIDHPCYNHAGVIDAFWEFMEQAVLDERRRIERVIMTMPMTVMDGDHETFWLDRNDILQKLKEK